MSDTFKKIEVEEAINAEETHWKDVPVEKEHQPETVKSTMNYRDMERQLESINNNITSFTEQKAVLEAEMLQVKATAEA